MNKRTFDNRLPANKRREQFQLARFADTWVEFPLGERRFASNGEKPDLRVRTTNGMLGIEHTELQYKPDGAKQAILRKAESLQERVIDRAKRLYDAQGGPNLYLSVQFDPSKPLTKKNVDNVAASLAQVILNIAQYPVATESCALVEAHSYERLFGIAVPVEVRHILYNSVSTPAYVVWFAEHTHMVPDVSIPILQDAMDKKADKLPSYRQNCDSVWLLLASSGLYPSSDFAIPEEVRTHLFHSPFDRVFYCNCFKGEVLKLNLASVQITP